MSIIPKAIMKRLNRVPRKVKGTPVELAHPKKHFFIADKESTDTNKKAWLKSLISNFFCSKIPIFGKF